MRGAAGTLKRALRKVFREALLIGFQEVVEAAAASERKGSAYISIPCEGRCDDRRVPPSVLRGMGEDMQMMDDSRGFSELQVWSMVRKGVIFSLKYI